MAEFRNILADGDLIRQRQAPRWWLFGDKSWAPYRNLSREVSCLEEQMHAAHAAYQAARERYVVAQTNVKVDKDLLTKHLGCNSTVSYELESDESILSRRDGVKYNMSGNNQKQKQSGNNGNGNNGQNDQKGGDNGNGNNQNQNQNQKGNNNQQKGKQSGVVTVGQLLNAKLVLH